MNEILLNMQRARFGQSSEKRAYVLEDAAQVNLFNEAEQEAMPKGATVSNSVAGVVIDCLNQACGRRGHLRGVLLHSDRGSQYCSHEYQRILQKSGFICSMSRNAALRYMLSLLLPLSDGRGSFFVDKPQTHVIWCRYIYCIVWGQFSWLADVIFIQSF